MPCGDFPMPPGVCPGCGRCRHCGQPYHSQPVVQPFAVPYYGQPAAAPYTIIVGGATDLDLDNTSYGGTD